MIRYLLGTGRKLMVLTLVTAVIGGLCNAALIALINHVLTHEGGLAKSLLFGFVVLGLGKLMSAFAAQISLVRFSQQIIADLRRDLVERILKVPLRRLEEVGTARLMVTLSEDIAQVTQALLIIPSFAVNVAILLGGAIYLGWLAWEVALGMGVLMLLGTFAYRLLIVSGFRHLVRAREEEDRLFGCFRGLTEGIKELKLHRERRGEFTEGVREITERFSQCNVSAEIRFIIAHTWTQLLFFMLVGIILFGLPHMQAMSQATLTGYVVTTLYLMGPLAAVIGSISIFGRGNIAFGKIEDMGASLAAEECATELSHVKTAIKPFESLELVDVTHSYHREREDEKFILGPINIKFQPGEIVYLVGGNGSGKSTLAKLIAGLYPPEQGRILLNGKIVTDQTRDDFRQIFSAVFSDFHVFESLLGIKTENLDEQARVYLEQLHLSHKVKVRNGTLSTTALSQGQRKRLALLAAYLEERPFFLFDEWASDQDPLFKQVFYKQLIPELKRLGRTILVITHDDKYFHLADRLLKLDYGKMVYQPQLEGALPECAPHLPAGVSLESRTVLPASGARSLETRCCSNPVKSASGAWL